MNQPPSLQMRTPWRFLLAVYAVIVIVTIAVPVLDWTRRPAGSTYTGFSYESVGDIFYYLNLIEQGASGNLLFRNFMTGEPHGPTFLHPLFLVLGWISGLFHLAPLVVWHAARALLTLLFLIALEKLLRTFVAGERQRRWIFVFMLIAGGLLARNADGSLFLPLLYSPLQVFTLLTTTVFFLLFLHQRERWTRWSVSLLLGLTSLQAVNHPYTLLIWISVPFVFLWVEVLLRKLSVRQAIRQYTPVAVAGFAGVLYLALVVLGSPILRAWSVRAMNPPWHLADTLLILGVRPILFLIGVAVVWPMLRRNAGLRLLLVWTVTVLALAHSPYPYAGRLMLLLHIPLGVIAGMGAWQLWQRAGMSAAKRLAVFFFLTLAISDNASHLWQNLSGHYPGSGFRYLDGKTHNALQWVRQETPEHALILHASTWDTLFSQQAYRRSYIVSGGLTADYERKLFPVLSIYAGQYTQEQLRDFLRRMNIQYIVLSDRERISGYAETKIYGNPWYAEQYAFNFHPQLYPFLRLVYDNQGFWIYQFVDVQYAQQ